MRYSLRALVVVMLLVPPIVAGAWWTFEAYRPRKHRSLFEELEAEGTSELGIEELIRCN
jgi:hypothetical protein